MKKIEYSLNRDNKADKKIFYHCLYYILFDAGISYEHSKYIAHNVSNIYDRPWTHYHSHYHINYINEFVNKNNIKLETWQKLSIYFHDAIYYPGDPHNEIGSAEYAYSLLHGHISSYELERAHKVICLTKEHTKDYLVMDDAMAMVMDLDLANLGSDFVNYCRASEDIEKEFSYLTKEEYLIGRKSFIETMLARDSIFRTEIFLNSGFEENARSNLEQDLVEIDRKIESIGFNPIGHKDFD